MSLKLQAIENALMAINGAVFQELCDSFLYFHNENYSLFRRVGSQTGKQKTVKGTPDTFMMLPNGKYIFVEFTTNSTQKNKLDDDISKCLDEAKKLGINYNEISEIIFCINFNISLEKIKELKQLLTGTNISLRIFSLNELSIELQSNHRDLLFQYLGLKYDTGQIVSLEQFISEYDRNYQGIATPLNNKFKHRENELLIFQNALDKFDFIVLSGSSGVGKTKLAIEGIKKFENNNSSYHSYSISYKNFHILEDLYQYFNNENNYILFVDDVNRIDSFSQILSFYNSKTKGKIKIIMTVRDYALLTLKKMLLEKNIKEIILEKFSDDNLIDIIKEEPFKILNPIFQKEILRIADGNPRIAIMASKLAIENQNIGVLSNVYELFDKYFSTYLKDNSILEKKIVLKSLGLIAFFNVLPYKEKELMENILIKFEINYSSFIECIEELEKLEIVNIQYQHVKIPEQNLSTYFFYKSFFENKVLDFEILINNYFEKNTKRFTDTIIPANNSFGPKNVYIKVKPHFIKYLKSSNINTELLFSNFWFYLEEETLEYIYNTIETLPVPDTKEYKKIELKSYSKNDFLLDLIFNFCIHINNFDDAIALSFEYVKKRPLLFSELIENIKNQITFNHKEAYQNFPRQQNLFSFLEKEIEKNDDEIYIKTFLEIIENFLLFTSEYTEAGRNNSYSFIKFPIPATEEVKKIRKIIWKRIDILFPSNQTRIFEFLKKYGDLTPDVIKELMEFDCTYLIEIIDTHLKKNNFEHCQYVQNQISWLRRNDIDNENLKKLEQKFYSNLYKLSTMLDYDKYRDKQSYEFDNYLEYEALKEKEIRMHFKFEDISSFNEFYKSFLSIYAITRNNYNFSKSLNIILNENLKHSINLGLEMLDTIVSEKNSSNFVPYTSFRNFIHNDKFRIEIWNLISADDFNEKNKWAFEFFDNLDKKFISDKTINDLIGVIKSIKSNFYIKMNSIDKFININPNLSKQICDILISKYENNIFIQIDNEFFNCLNCDVPLLKRLYLIEDKINRHFDYEGDILFTLLKKDSSFLVEYITFLGKKDNQLDSRNYDKFSVIWGIENIERILETLFDQRDHKYYFGILEDFYNVFFERVDEKYYKKSYDFLLTYLQKNYKNHFRINLIMDIVRHSRKEDFDEVITYYLKLNTNVEDFKKIHWYGNSKSFSGEQSYAELLLNDYQRLLSIVEKSGIGFKLIPIKSYLKKQIEGCKQALENEMKERFIGKGFE